MSIDNEPLMSDPETPTPRPLCSKCRKEMRIVSLIDDHAVIERILRHLGLWEQGIRVLPARAAPEEAGLDIASPISLYFLHESATSDRFQRADARAA